MGETTEVVAMAEELWKPNLEELFAVCATILFLVCAFVYAGALFMGMAKTAFVTIFITFVLYAFLAYGPVQTETDNRLMKPAGFTGVLFLVFYIIDTFFLHLTSYWREIFEYIFISPILALLLAQFMYVYIIQGRKGCVLPQESKIIEKQLKAIMYLAVFLTVFVTSATAKGDYDNLLGTAIYSLAISIIFLFLIVENAPFAETKKLIFTIGLGIILGITVSLESINLFSILASGAGVAAAIVVYYILSDKKQESIVP